MSGGIKELLADVEVKTEDIGATQVTDAKINPSVGKWLAVPFTTVTTSAAATFLATAAVTVIDAIIQITTKGSAGVTVKLEDTAGTSLLAEQVGSSTYTHRLTTNTALDTMPGVLSLAAGKSMQLITSGACDLVGNLYVEYIATP